MGHHLQHGRAQLAVQDPALGLARSAVQVLVLVPAPQAAQGAALQVALQAELKQRVELADLALEAVVDPAVAQADPVAVVETRAVPNTGI
jgi:hypothetical protein